jgi:hypothetical protein
MIVHREKDLPSVHEEFEALQRFQPANLLRCHTGRKAEIHQDYRWVNDIGYVDTEQREHTLSVVRCIETKPGKDGVDKTTRFQWITNIKVTRGNAVEVAQDGGRNRWRIENEGFNVQKNGGFELEHAYSNDPIGCKIYYLLLQIAYTLFQLIQRGSLFRTAFPKGVGSARNLSFRLLEAWRNLRLSQDFLDTIRCERFQIRFDTS